MDPAHRIGRARADKSRGKLIEFCLANDDGARRLELGHDGGIDGEGE